jgi:hypothetical protein
MTADGAKMTNSLCHRCQEISRCREEQLSAAQAVGRDTGPGGARLWLADWTMEEILLAAVPCSCDRAVAA